MQELNNDIIKRLEMPLHKEIYTKLIIKWNPQDSEEENSLYYLGKVLFPLDK